MDYDRQTSLYVTNRRIVDRTGTGLITSSAVPLERESSSQVSSCSPGWPTMRSTNYYHRTFLKQSAEIVTQNSGYYNSHPTEAWDWIDITDRFSALSGYSPSWTSINQDAIEDALSNKTRNAINDSKFSLPVAIGEFGETTRMIANTATRLARCYSALRRGDLNSCLRGLDLPLITKGHPAQRKWNKEFGSDARAAASNTWLEYTYGWVPLINDVFNAAETFANLLHRPSSYETSVRQSVSSAVAPSTTGNVRHSETYRVRDHIVYRLPEGELPVADALGLTDPLTVAWELLPFSFVCDWFLPIGDALRAINSIPRGTTFVRGTRSWVRSMEDIIDYNKPRTVQTSTHNVQQWPFGTGTKTSYSSSTGSGHVTGYQYTRRVLSGFPSAATPHFKNPFSASHVTSALALLNQAFHN